MRLPLVKHLYQRVHFLAGIIQKHPQIIAVIGKNAAAAAIGDNGGFKIGLFQRSNNFTRDLGAVFIVKHSFKVWVQILLQHGTMQGVLPLGYSPGL